ncbi:hypothetical protein ACFOWE_06285 [Planomonospora corallina]|uniref:Uncharacterized protein n=1 Tax=Planomonospora corallina TaxID=1806052 RepID=A0ABV8I4A4_9ACTN
MTTLAPVAIILAPIALIVVPRLADDLDPRRITRFASRQRLTLTAGNIGPVLAYLRVTRRWRALGLTFGALALLAFEPFVTLNALYPLLGWLAGVVVAETRLARARPAGCETPGLRLVSPAVTWLWAVSAVTGGALAVSGMVRSLRRDLPADAPPSETPLVVLLWAVAVVAVAAAVLLPVRGLRTRPLPAAPDDLVAAEVAARSRSAHALLTGGSVAALWCGLQASLPDPPGVLAPLFVLAGWVAPAVALAMGTRQWAPGPRAPRRPRWAAPVTAVAAFWAAAVLGTAFTWAAALDPAQRPPLRTVHDEDTTVSQPVTEAVLKDCGDRRTVRDCTTWELISATESPDEPTGMVSLPQAAAFAGRRGPLPRPAPFALSGDGFHAVYLDARTRRMVHHDLRTGARRDLTGPLADADLPVPVLSHDGRHAALTTTGPGPGGTRLVEVGGGRSAEVPGIARVLGVGPRGFTAVTVPEGEKAELVTVGLDGGVRARAPFDPAACARLFPDGRRLLVLTSDGEAVTVDPATARTLRRVKIRLRLYEDADVPEILGWSGDGRFLARLDADDPDDEDVQLVDPATGKTAEPGFAYSDEHFDQRLRASVVGAVAPW